MAIQIGDTFGDYRVVGVLGKGGMGKVYRVRSLLTDREEAMKVVLPDLDDNPELADRFLREIRVHASLEHPNIAALRAAIRVDDRILMIMELVPGESLDDLLHTGVIELPTAIYYIDQVLSALNYAHSRGVVHRDIKPANILVTGPASGHAGVVKLTDFGIAQAAGAGKLTGVGMVVGSLWYMSPEQIRAEPVDARSDIYSVGLTFYQMVTGQRPIQGDSEYALINAQLTYMPPPPSDVMRGIPAALSGVIMQMLAKDPAHRFASANDVRAALRASLTRTAPAPAPAAAPPAPPPPAAAPAALSPAFLEKVTHALAPHIGPIAKVVVNRAAKSARSESELVQTVGAEIASEPDRARFIASMR